MAYDNPNGARGASGLNVLAGIWLFASAFWLASGAGTNTNNLWVGVAVAVLAAIRFFAGSGAAGLSWVNVLLGLYTIAAPWIVGFSDNGSMTTNNVITGIVIAALGIWAAVGAGSGTRSDLGMGRPAHGVT